MTPSQVGVNLALDRILKSTVVEEPEQFTKAVTPLRKARFGIRETKPVPPPQPLPPVNKLPPLKKARYGIKIEEPEQTQPEQLPPEPPPEPPSLDFSGIKTGVPSYETYRKEYYKSKGWLDYGDPTSFSYANNKVFAGSTETKPNTALMSDLQHNSEVTTMYEQTYGSGARKLSAFSKDIAGVLPTTAKLISPEKPKIEWYDPFWDIGILASLGTGSAALRAVTAGAFAIAQTGSTVTNWDNMTPAERALNLGLTGLTVLGAGVVTLPAIQTALKSKTAAEASQKVMGTLKEMATSEAGGVKILGGGKVPKEQGGKYVMELSTTRGGSPFTEKITVTPVGDNVVGRQPNAFATSENLYGVYTKEGKLIKGGFDKHSQAMEYAKTAKTVEVPFTPNPVPEGYMVRGDPHKIGIPTTRAEVVGGAWFTDDISYAEKYGKQISYAESPKNPLLVSTSESPEKFIENWATKRGIERVKNDRVFFDSVRSAIKKEGYDSVKFKSPEGITEYWVLERPNLLSSLPKIPPVTTSLKPTTPTKFFLPEPPRVKKPYIESARKAVSRDFKGKTGVIETVEEANQLVRKARDIGTNAKVFALSYVKQAGDITKEFGLNKLGQATKIGKTNFSTAINDVLSNYTRYNLTPKQLEIAKRSGFIYKEAKKLAQSYGVNINELGNTDEFWQYIARRVKGKLNPLTGKYEFPQTSTGGFKMGAKISAQKERQFEQMAEGVDLGFLYEHPDQVLETHIAGIYRLIGNKQAEDLIKPLTRQITKDMPLTFGERNIYEPSLRNRAANAEVANAIDKIFEAEKLFKPLKVARDISGALTGQVAAMDISAPFIQGLPLIGHDLKMGLMGKPSFVWVKSYGKMLETLKNPEQINTFRTKNTELYKRFMEAGGITGDSEFVSGVSTMQIALRKVPVIGKTLKEAYRHTWGRTGQAYSDFLEIARLKLFEQLEPVWIKNGGNIYDLGNLTNKMTGTVSASARGVGVNRKALERTMAFAPNYLRSSLLLLQDLMGNNMTSREVASSISALIGVGGALYYVEEKMQGREPKMKPWAKKFGGDGADAFTVPIGETRVGLGSWLYGMVKMAADIGATAIDEPDALLKWNEQHPVYRFVKSKRGAGIGLISDLATGTNFYGQKYDSPNDYLIRILESLVPISGQSIITQEPKGKPEQVVAEAMGLRAYPLVESLPDNVLKELRRMDITFYQPDKKIWGNKLTPEQYKYYQDITRKYMQEYLEGAISDSFYQSDEDSSKKAVLQSLMSDARESARLDVAEKYGLSEKE